MYIYIYPFRRYAMILGSDFNERGGIGWQSVKARVEREESDAECKEG